ncbi:hypothetical protein NYV36_19060 [Escherichia coli]|nr:hypothetical protein [Escherichia coli]
MGNRARVADGATVVSTSTRNFPNRLGTGANVFRLLRNWLLLRR